MRSEQGDSFSIPYITTDNGFEFARLVELEMERIRKCTLRFFNESISMSVETDFFILFNRG